MTDDLLEPRPGDGPAAGRRGPSSSCCRAAATRSACSTWRSASPARGGRRALHVNYGLRAESGDDEASLPRALRASSASRLEVHTARRPEDAGNLQAWARDVRLGRGARLAIAARRAAGDRPHRLRPGRDDPLPARGLARAAAPCSGMAARDGLLVRPLLGVTRDETAAHCTARGLTWREDASNDDPAYARNRARAGLVPALRELHPAAEANVVRTAELLRDEAAVLDEVVDTALAGRDRIAVGAPRRAAARARAARRAPPRRGRGGAPVRARRRPAAGHRRAGRRRAGPRRRRPRDRRGRRAAHRADAAGPLGARPAGDRPVPGAAPRLRASCATTPSERSSSSPTTCRGASASSGRQITEDYAGRDLLLVGVLKGAVFFLSDLMREIEVPCEVDFMAVASYGSSTDSSGVVRILKDLDDPIAGRHVLIVEDIVDSGLTLQYLLRNLAARDPLSIEVCALLTKPARRKVAGRAALRGLRDPRPLRRRLRPRSRRALPQPPLRGGAGEPG